MDSSVTWLWQTQYYLITNVSPPGGGTVMRSPEGAESPTPEFVKTWGGSSYDYLFAVAVDSAGNIYCAGFTWSFGAGNYDALLLKYNSSGTLQWAKTWGGSGNDFLYAVAVDSAGNIYCAGRTYSFGAGYDDALLLKYDSSGALQWAKTWGGSSNDTLYGVAVDSAGNIYCAGWTYSFGAGENDALLLKYNSSGALQWAKTWGGSNYDYLYAVAVDSSGNIYCAGYTYSFGAGGSDALLLKYNSSGTLQWATTWGGGNYDYLWEVAVDSGGNIYCAGYTDSFGAGSGDALLLKYDSSGALQWAKTWDGGSDDHLFAVAVDSTGNLYLVGDTASYTGIWQAQTGSQTSPSGSVSSPTGVPGSPSGTQTSPTGTQTSPTGSETGAGGTDTLLLKETTASSPDGTWYDSGTVVQLTATANAGYAFLNWSGDLSGTENPQNLTMNVPKRVTANFTISNPRAVTVSSPYGQPNPPVGATNYPDGYYVTVSCGPTPYSGSAGTRYVCTGWTGGSGDVPPKGGATSYTIPAITQDSAITWTWKTQYELTSVVSPPDSGTITCVPSGPWYDPGTIVSCNATPNAGCNWLEWSGDLTGTANPHNLVMDSPKIVTANFNYTIYVNGTNGLDTNNGLSWTQAVKTIQRGLDLASITGQTVWVANGTYTGTGNKNLDFKGKAIHLKSVGGAANCIIVCQSYWCGFYFHASETNTSVVEGFTIRNGADSGIICYYSSPTITNCAITNNFTDWNGGGIRCESSRSLSENSTS
jgi:uncharacterized delta-60 repeat protein